MNSRFFRFLTGFIYNTGEDEYYILKDDANNAELNIFVNRNP
jgi:hypothetical protein